MKRLLFVWSALLLFFCTFVSVSAEPVVLDLETCLELAVEQSPDLMISGISLEAAEREKENSWNNFLPNISAGINASGSSPIVSDSFSLNLGAGASLNATLSLNPGISHQIESLKLACQSEQISYQTAERELLSAVEKEFYYLITSQASLDIAKANWELAVKNYEQAVSSHSYGRASELTVLQAKITAANLEPAYKESVATHKAEIRSFLIVLGMDPDTEIELGGELEADIVDFDIEQLISLLSGRLDLQAMQLNLETIKNNKVQTSVSSKLPTLSLSGGWSLDLSQEINDSASLALSLTLPIDDYFSGSSTSLTLAAFDDQIRQAEIQIDDAYTEAQTEIINLVNQLNTASDNLGISALNIELAKKTYEMSEESYTRGLIERLEVDDAQQSFLSAKYQYLSNQYTYLIGLINLRDALGLETIEDLYSKGVAK